MGQVILRQEDVWTTRPSFLELLGPSVDILIWIPKVLLPEWPAQLRPLQIPTCFRRLVGAMLADAAGPVVEPLLSSFQTA
eukprot:15457364-Alexandrium_andersonii.AAC.1